METGSFIYSFLALLFVIGLIGLTALLIRKFGQGKLLSGFYNIKKTGERRLSVEEILPIDARRRLLLIKRDDTEHLILTGADGDLLIERNIRKKNFRHKGRNEDR